MITLYGFGRVPAATTSKVSTGTRDGDKLVVRYFIKGKIFGASIDTTAAGTLVPSAAQ